MGNPFILRSYRELLRLIARLPKQEQHQGLQQARSELRKNAAVSEEQAADLNRILVGKISFLRMKVPRFARDAGKVGAATFVVREGKVVEGVGRTLGNRCARTI